MKKLIGIVALAVVACKSPKKTPPPIASKTEISKSLDSLNRGEDKVKESIDRYNYVLSVVTKKNDFMMKKLDNEAMYYKTSEEKYRRRANRYVDSCNKYVKIIQKLAKEYGVK